MRVSQMRYVLTLPAGSSLMAFPIQTSGEFASGAGLGVSVVPEPVGGGAERECECARRRRRRLVCRFWVAELPETDSLKSLR